jgi:hypothetical protein
MQKTLLSLDILHVFALLPSVFTLCFMVSGDGCICTVHLVYTSLVAFLIRKIVMGDFVPQPGVENELRGGFRGVFRPHAVKRRNRSVSESYSMDLRQQSNSDRQTAQQFQKRVRRLSGGPSSSISQSRRQAESLGPSCSGTSQAALSSSGRMRSNSFNSERALGSSSSNFKHSTSKDANQSTNKARVNFDLGESEPGTSYASCTMSGLSDQISRCKVRESGDSTTGSPVSKPVHKKKESSSCKNSVEKQKRSGNSKRDATSKERDVTEHVALSETKHENRSLSSPKV